MAATFVYDWFQNRSVNQFTAAFIASSKTGKDVAANILKVVNSWNGRATTIFEDTY